MSSKYVDEEDRDNVDEESRQIRRIVAVVAAEDRGQRGRGYFGGSY